MAIDKTDRVAQKRSRMIRWGVLGAALAVITGFAYAHQVMGAGKPPGVDALCPFGGLETIFTFIAGTGFVEKTAISAVVLLVITIGLALLYRRSFCGQICPLGTLQGIFGAAGRRITKKRIAMPAVLDRPARYLKYVVLAVFILWTWQASALVMRPYDPWAAYAHLASGDLFEEFSIGLAVLGVALAGSFVYDRFFCKYLCPMGAFLGLFSKVSFLRISRDAEACIDCGKCDKACPMNVTVATADTVSAAECISCNECVNVCPAAGALEVEAPGGKKLSALAVTGIVAGVMVAVIAVANVAGAFPLRMPTLSEAIEQSGGTPGAVGADFDTSLIKGSMTMSEISEATGIPEEEFVAEFGVSEAELGGKLKDVKANHEWTPEDVRLWVSQRLAEAQ